MAVRYIAFALSVFIASAVQAETTTVELRPDAPETPYLADYSQGILLTARLTDSAGEPIAGERITFQFTQRDDATTQFTLADPITDAQGIATARLTFVNGRYGGKTFEAAAPDDVEDGFPYLVRALFLGSANPLGCDGTVVEDDDTFCDSDDEHALFLLPEVTQLSVQAGIEVGLGEEVTLVAQLTDENGNAPEAGTDVDGDSVVPIDDGRISFFYDVDGNGRPSLDELLGEANTNSDGVATFSFVADPSFARASNISDGIHAQYGGDDYYGLAGASQDILVLVGPPDVDGTLLDITPATVTANGFADVELKATLVDAFNNIYSEESEPQIVEFTTTAGRLEGTVERNPIDGTYSQMITAPLEAADATITVVINGVSGKTGVLPFSARPGCNCKATNTTAPFLLFPAFAVMAFVRRHHRDRNRAA